MTEFNVNEEVQKAAEKLHKELQEKSFSGRNPQLGRMVNCSVCDSRHRAAQVCEQKFAMGSSRRPVEDQILLVAAKTRNGVLGAKQFKGKRLKPHPSKANLQLIQLTQDLFPMHFPFYRVPEPENATPEEITKQEIESATNAMTAARVDARRMLLQKSYLLRRRRRRQQDISRRINQKKDV